MSIWRQAEAFILFIWGTQMQRFSFLIGIFRENSQSQNMNYTCLSERLQYDNGLNQWLHGLSFRNRSQKENSQRKENEKSFTPHKSNYFVNKFI